MMHGQKNIKILIFCQL